MTITLTTEELEDYGTRVQKWYSEFLNHLFSNASKDPYRDSLVVYDFRKLREEYEKAHPKPTWKDLL